MKDLIKRLKAAIRKVPNKLTLQEARQQLPAWPLDPEDDAADYGECCSDEEIRLARRPVVGSTVIYIREVPKGIDFLLLYLEFVDQQEPHGEKRRH